MVDSRTMLPDGPLLDGSLQPEPATPGGALIGYARVSTRDQRLDRQLAALTGAGCIRIFADKKSGRNADREELAKALDYLRPGDTLVVPSLDRLGRSLQDLITIVAALRKQQIGFRSLHEALDTTTTGGRLVFHVFAALAELIIEGTREGARHPPRPPTRDDQRTDRPRPGDARPARGHHRLHRPPARRLPRRPLQVRPRTEGRTTVRTRLARRPALPR